MQGERTGPMQGDVDGNLVKTAEVFHLGSCVPEAQPQLCTAYLGDLSDQSPWDKLPFLSV